MRPRNAWSRGRWTSRTLVASMAMGAVSCAQFSPQIVDQRPTYGFTSRAASSPEGGGYYDAVCGPNSPTKDSNSCPKFYGLLPAALDDADALRQKLITAELNDSGAPLLATAIALPVGAYAIYRGIFGSGEAVKKEIAKIGLAGGAAYGWLSATESRPRQQVRMGAIEALNCAMYGSAARYLYEAKDIENVKPAAQPPNSQEAKEPEVAKQQEEKAAGSLPNLEQSQRDLVKGAGELREALYKLRAAISEQPTSVQRAFKDSGCEGASTTCQLRKKGSSTVENPIVKAATAEALAGEALLKEVEPLQIAARGLHQRIRGAHLELKNAVNRIQDASNKAVLATESDVAALRAAVGNMKLGSQTLSGVLAQAVTAQASSGTSNFVAQSAERTKGADATGGKDEFAASRIALTPDRNAVRNASLALQEAMRNVKTHLGVDLERAELVRSLGSCEFVPPGLKLVVDPSGPIILESGASVRLSALGGSSMPTVTLTGATNLKSSDVLRVETSDTTAGRQTLSVLVTAPKDAASQDLRLVFRNEDLVQVRDIAIRKSEAKK